MLEISGIVLGALLINNFVLAQFLGLCPFMGSTRQYDTALAMGVATAFVLTLSATLCYALYHFVLVPLSLEYLRIIGFIVLVAGAVALTEIYLRSTSRVLYQLLGIYLPLITTNCMVLGVALLAILKDLNLIQTIAFALGAAAGFSLVMVLFAALRERLDSANVPAALQGTPITFISAGLMSLAVYGLRGVGA